MDNMHLAEFVPVNNPKVLRVQKYLGLGRVAEEELDLGGAVELGINPHPHLARGGILAHLVDALAFPGNRHTNVLKRQHHKLSHALEDIGGSHKVVGLGLLQHHPHHLDVVARMSPVTLGVNIALNTIWTGKKCS